MVFSTWFSSELQVTELISGKSVATLSWSVLCWKLDEKTKTAPSGFKIFGFEIAHDSVKSDTTDTNTTPLL